MTELFNEQLSSISALIGTKKIESISVVNDSNIEEGYAVAAVNSEVNVLLLVKVYILAKGLGWQQGRVDLRLHLEKTEEKLTTTKEKLGKLQDQMNAPGYKSKVDSEVKEADEERLKNLTAEVETMDSFVASLRKLTLQES